MTLHRFDSSSVPVLPYNEKPSNSIHQVLILSVVSVVGVDVIGKPWWDKTTGSKSLTTGTRSTDYFLIAAFTAWTQGICFVPGLVHATRTVVRRN